MTAAAEDGPGLRDVAGGPPRVIRAPVKGADATLENLADVDVFLLGTFRALRCHDLRRVRVYGGPIAGSAHVQRLEAATWRLPRGKFACTTPPPERGFTCGRSLGQSSSTPRTLASRRTRSSTPAGGGARRGGVGRGDGCVAGRGRFRVDQEAAVAELAHLIPEDERDARAETTRRGRDEGRDERVALLDYPIIFEDYVSRIRGFPTTNLNSTTRRSARRHQSRDCDPADRPDAAERSVPSPSCANDPPNRARSLPARLSRSRSRSRSRSSRARSGSRPHCTPATTALAAARNLRFLAASAPWPLFPEARARASAERHERRSRADPRWTRTPTRTPRRSLVRFPTKRPRSP